MAFTGSAVVEQISDAIVRVSNVSLAAGATGIITLHTNPTPPGGAVVLPAAFKPEPYRYNNGPIVSLIASIDVETQPIAGGAGLPSSAMFYGTTTGTGSEGNDYVATVAAGAAVPFPRSGPTVGADVVRSGSSTTQFQVLRAGNFRVAWAVGFAEASQLEVAVNGTSVPRTDALSNAVNQQNTNEVLVTLAANDLVTIINPVGNGTALTVSPAAGALTHAQAPSLVIERVSPSLSGFSNTVVKTGADDQTFQAAITNGGDSASSSLEFYIKFHE